jgi:serine/threonine-protein kinase HipA
MLEKEDGTFSLSPAYDLVNTHLVIKGEAEQMSLNLNGKKNKISRKDFDALGLSLKLTEKQIQNCYNIFIDRLDKLNWWIDNSFLSTENKNDFKQIVLERIELLK